jgi:hypothetical protein
LFIGFENRVAQVPEFGVNNWLKEKPEFRSQNSEALAREQGNDLLMINGLVIDHLRPKSDDCRF